MAKNEDDVPILISEDDARGGVTGHHVRYVLTFGLAGIIIAFIAIGVYFDYGALTQAISKVFAAEGIRQRLFSTRFHWLGTRRRRAPARSVGHGLGTQRKCQPNRDALARRAAIHRPLFGDGHALLVR